MGLFDTLALTPIQKDGKLGCENCPRNKAKGINKIMGEVKGRKILVWTQSPGVTENVAGKELVGKAGQFLWRELSRVSIIRSDCDIQHVVRCMPADREEGRWVGRDPTKDELRCCSIYNKQAIQRNTAKVWIVLGKIAAEQLFGKSQKEKIFQFGPSKVFILDHPSYFLKGAPQVRLTQFRTLLDRVAEEVNNTTGKPILPAGLKDVDYKMITTEAEAIKARDVLLRHANNGIRIAYDEEDDEVDGKRAILCLGACAKPRVSYVFILDHPENPASKQDRKAVKQIVCDLMEHKHSKILHHGTHDVPTLAKTLGCKVEGYDWDTQYSEYLSDPPTTGQRSYAMNEIVTRRFTKFIGFKEVILPEVIPCGMTYKDAQYEGKLRFSQVPLDKLVLRNGADADITKRMELTTKNKVNPALVKVYVDAAFVLKDMETFGPLFDVKQCDRLLSLYPNRKEEIVNKLRMLADTPAYNPNSTQQNLHLLFSEKGSGGFGFEPPYEDKKPSTNKETLQLLSLKYKHPFIKGLQEYRQLKNWVERIDAFKRSAEVHNGRVTTAWLLTTTATGRLSSGGGGKSKKDKRALGNLQNVPRNTHVKNVLVSDLGWLDTAKYLVELNATDKICGSHLDTEVFLAADMAQHELRMIAQITGEPELIRLFKLGKDIHASVGAAWSGWSYTELQEDEHKRRIVKAFIFGVCFGLTAFGLWKDLRAEGVKISESEVNTKYKQFFQRFKRIKQFIDGTPKFVEENGYVENIFGFRVPIDIHRTGGAFWKNACVNYPIQGGAHQVLLCMMALKRRYPERYQLVRPQLEVHDSFINVSKLRHLKIAMGVLTALMTNDVLAMTEREFGIKWKVPLEVELKIGFRLGDMVKIKGSLRETVINAATTALKHGDELLEIENKYKGTKDGLHIV